MVRLQVQRSRLKPGPATTRVYDPAPLLEVEALEVGPRGVVGQTADGPVLDVHHADHPDTRNRRLANGLSLLPRARLRRPARRATARTSSTASPARACCSTPPARGPGPTSRGALWLETVDGDLLELSGTGRRPPCVEFSRFCLGLAPGPVGPDVRQALVDLDGGARGFYAEVSGTGRVERGARLLRG